MDYTFKNSLSGKACTIVLTDYCLTIQSAGKEEDIPYANITTVRLSKGSRKTYKTFLYPDNHDPILVTNFYHLSGGEVEDRSRQYSTFVRVLHLHLKEKSSAAFTSGLSMSWLIAWGVGSVLTALLISLAVRFFAPEILNGFLIGLVVSIMLTAGAFIFNNSKLPKYYLPAAIPLEFLP